MTTYRERREAKADRLREWADKREAKSDAAFKRSNELSDMIPFGQPILVGHHSEGRARRDQDRIFNGMRTGVENSRKAEEFRGRADNIEAAADNAVYSDDEDAVERLTVRIAEREAQRDRIKSFNTHARKTGKHDLSLLDENQKGDYMSIVRNASYQLGKKGEFPSYALSNLGATIRKDKKRLEQMTD